MARRELCTAVAERRVRAPVLQNHWRIKKEKKSVPVVPAGYFPQECIGIDTCVHACIMKHVYLSMICTHRMMQACCIWPRRQASMHPGKITPVHVICHSLLGQFHKLVHPSPSISCTWKRLDVVPVRGLEKRQRPVEPACEHSRCSIYKAFTHMWPHARHQQ